jgi:raffinose/stachyose/melibiose transport system permease protein
MPAQPKPDFEQHVAREADVRASVRLAPAAAIAGSAIPADYHRPRRSAFLRRAYIWFILPALVAYGVIFLYPTARAFILSFFDWPGYGPIGAFVGIQNFRDVITSSKFHTAAINSAKLFLAMFVLQNTVSLGLALMLNRRSRMTHVYRAIIFLPQIMSAVATGIIWVLMLDPIIGVVNPVLHDIGLGALQRQWQANPDWAMKVVYLVQFWQWNGMAVVLFLAGLQNVPEDLRHAALIDGANRWRVFRDVVFPLLAPAFTIVTVLSFILIFRAFDLIYVLGGVDGAPNHHTLVLGVLIYGDAFGTSSFSNSTRFSYAMAEGVTLFVFLAGVSALLLKALGRREEAVQV